jgi:hypothetical protein
MQRPTQNTRPTHPPPPTRPALIVVLLAALAAVTLTACGGSHNTPASSQVAQSTPPPTTSTAAAGETVVARVAGTPITQAQVSHWMNTLEGTIYHTVSSFQSPGPEGLVSDPPDYGRCVKTLEATEAAVTRQLGHPRESSTELLTKCRELNQALKIEATSHLIGTQQIIQIARQEHITISPTELQHFFNQVRAREYPTETDLHNYLTSRRMTLPDLLLETKLDLINQTLTNKLKLNTPQGQTHYTTLQQQATTQTTCQPTYNVEGCNQHKPGPTYPTPSPAILIEQIYALNTNTCTDPTACSKQIGQ